MLCVALAKFWHVTFNLYNVYASMCFSYITYKLISVIKLLHNIMYFYKIVAAMFLKLLYACTLLTFFLSSV